MSFFFFKKDGECKWMTKQTEKVYPKQLREPIKFNNKEVQFYLILDWIKRKNKGANMEWLNEIEVNYVQSVEDLPEGAGIYITGYDADLQELAKAKAKGIPILENPCPWIKKLREELFRVNTETHQLVLMIIKGHMVYDCYQSAFPDDIIVVEPETYEEEISKLKNDKPIHFLVYAAFRQKDALQVIDYINENYPHPENNLDTYKKTICMWTKQGVFEEIQETVKEKKLDEIWIICSSEGDTSTRSLVREVRESGTKPYLVKSEEDIPQTVDPKLNIGVLYAGIPLSNIMKTFATIIKERFIKEKLAH